MTNESEVCNVGLCAQPANKYDMIGCSSSGVKKVVVKGRFDGKQVVMDGPIPSGVGPDPPIDIVFNPEPCAQPSQSLDKLFEMAVDADLPPDFAEQHEHYVKGTSKRVVDSWTHLKREP